MIVSGDTHYSCAIRADDLRRWAKEKAMEVQEQFNEGGDLQDCVPIFVFTGLSGITAATALTQQFEHGFQHGMMYIRKPEEKSHGMSIETSNLRTLPNRKHVYVICDDFVSSGRTFGNILNSMQETYGVEVDLSSVYWVLTGRNDGGWGAQKLEKHETANEWVTQYVPRFWMDILHAQAIHEDVRRTQHIELEKMRAMAMAKTQPQNVNELVNSITSEAKRCLEDSVLKSLWFVPTTDGIRAGDLNVISARGA